MSAAPADRAGHDRPRPVDEEVGAPGRIAGRLQAGHGMAAHVAEAELVRALEQRRLRAGDVGDDRGLGQHGSETGAQLVHRRQAGRNRRGQDDQVRSAHGLGRRRGRQVDRSVGQCLPGTLARRRPGGHRPGRPFGPRTNGAGDRTGDQPEAEEPDPHVPEYRSRPVVRVTRASRSPAGLLASLRHPPLRFVRWRTWVVRRIRPADRPSDGSTRAARRAGWRRSADSAAPRQRAPRSERRCRAGVRTTSRRAWASSSGSPQTCGSPARAASTRSSGYS